MATLSNTAEGTSGAALTSSNTAGPDQFGTPAISGAGAAVVIDSTQKHIGSTSIKHTYPASVAASMSYDWTLGSAASNSYHRVMLYVASANPTTNVRIAGGISGASSSNYNLLINTTGHFVLNNSAGSAAITLTATIPLDQWVRVEVDVTSISGTTANFALRQFSGANLYTSTPDTNGSGTASGATVVGTVSKVRWGNAAGNTMTAAWNYWMDDYAWSDTATPGPAIPPSGITSGTAAVTETSSGTSLTATLPSYSVGDVLVAQFATNGSTPTPSVSGWTTIQTVAGTTGSWSYYHVVTGTPTAPSFSWTGATRGTWVVQRYSGVDTTTPMDVASAQAGGGVATTVDAPSLTTVTNGARLISGATADASWTSTTITIPSGMTLVGSNTSAGAGRTNYIADEVRATAGATGVRTWTQTGVGLSFCTFIAALRPAAGSSGDPGYGHIILEDGSGSLEMEGTTDDYLLDTAANPPQTADSALTVTASLSADATKGVSGATTTTVTAGLSSGATRGVLAGTSTVATATLSSDAAISQGGASSFTATFTADATVTKATTGQTSTAATATVTAGAGRTTTGGTTTAVTATVSATAGGSAQGATSTPVTAALTSTGTRNTPGAADTPVSVNVTAAAATSKTAATSTTVTAGLTASAFAAPTPGMRDVAQNSGNNSAPTVTVPATAVVGDTVILVLSLNNTDNITATPSQLSLADATSGGSFPVKLYSATVNGSTLSASTVLSWTLSATRGWGIALYLAKGMTSGSPINTFGVLATVGSTLTMPSVTTTQDTWLLEIPIAKGNGTAISSFSGTPTGYTQQINQPHAGTFAGASVIADRTAGTLSPAGTYGGETTWAASATPGATVRYLVALDPLGAPITGATDSPVTASLTADAGRTTSGVASIGATAALTAAATVTAGTITAQTSTAVTATLTAQSARTSNVGSSTAVTAAVTSTATVTKVAATTTTVTATTTATARLGQSVQASLQVTVTPTATAGSPPKLAQVTRTVTVSMSATVNLTRGVFVLPGHELQFERPTEQEMSRTEKNRGGLLSHYTYRVPHTLIREQNGTWREVSVPSTEELLAASYYLQGGREDRNMPTQYRDELLALGYEMTP